MFQYIVRRLGFGVVTVLGVSLVVFTILRVLPGDPLVAIFGPEGFTKLSEAERARYMADLGLSDPLVLQYLQQPVAVLRDVRRVLRPGAPLVISFSNRCFWTKAVAVWRSLDDSGHLRLVERYLRHAGFEPVETRMLAEWVEDVSDPMFAVIGNVPQ